MTAADAWCADHCKARSTTSSSTSTAGDLQVREQVMRFHELKPMTAGVVRPLIVSSDPRAENIADKTARDVHGVCFPRFEHERFLQVPPLAQPRQGLTHFMPIRV